MKLLSRKTSDVVRNWFAADANAETGRERRLEAMQALAHVGDWEWDIASSRCVWSAEMCRIFGVDRENFVPTFEAYLERVHPDDRERARGEIERAIGACAPFRFEERIIRADGKIRVLRSQGQALAGDDGHAVRLVGVCQDITEYREAMDALRESEEQFRLLVEGVQDYAICMLDPCGNVVSWNSGAKRIKGYGVGEVHGRHFSLFYPPEDVVAGVPAAALAQATAIGTWEGEGWRIRKDGSRFWASTLITALRDRMGRLRGFTKVTQDITERQRNKELLTRQRVLLETILGQAADAIIACDAQGRMIFVNAAARRLANLDPDGTAVDFGPDVWGQAYDADGNAVPLQESSISMALRGTTTIGREEHRVRPDGSIYDILVSAAPIIMSDGSPAGAVATFSDITERNRTQAVMRLMTQRLRTLSRKLLEVQETERRKIARELHDEVGQSLTALKINLQTVYAAANDPRMLPLWEDTIGIVDRLLSQVRDLSLDLRPSLLDDLGLMQALRWYADRQSQRAGIPVVFGLDGPEAVVSSAAATTCFRIVQEGLTNALRHARPGNIHIKLSFRSDTLELTLADDGDGFDVDTMRERAVQGRSFGLLGMQERAELLAGSLRIDSQRGCGTVVRLSLPLASGDAGAVSGRDSAD